MASLPPVGFVTTWPCWTEAMYLLGRSGVGDAQDQLWDLMARRLVRLDLPEPNEWNRMRELMRQYHDCPMDLADASLVAAAERLGTKQIFTFDSHFRVYRLHGTGWFDVIP